MGERGFEREEDQPWRVLEFYSGIGGLRYSLVRAGLNADVIQAFDINEKANDVYEHNFRHRPYQGNIQSLSAADLDSYGAHAWLLSPPCQPYTRQGLQKHSNDARASSFINILDLLPLTSQTPLFLFVENVVGFETSDTHHYMIEILAKTGYVTQEFILTPLQFGVPYSRPRYYCLAKRKPLTFRKSLCNGQLLRRPAVLYGDIDDNEMINEHGESEESWDKLLSSCEPVERFLEFGKFSKQQVELEMSCTTSVSRSEALDRDEQRNGSGGNLLELYLVPSSLLERWGSAMDTVYPDSKRCCCFTKSYYRYVKGTGSLLATTQRGENNEVLSLKEQCLRYFTPREVANFHSFPEDFKFPNHISLKQRYALLGNSLSIAVVAPLLQYLFLEAS